MTAGRPRDPYRARDAAASGAEVKRCNADTGMPRCPLRDRGSHDGALAPRHAPRGMQVSTPSTTSVPHLAKLAFDAGAWPRRNRGGGASASRADNGAFLSKRGVTRRWRDVSDERGPHRAADR